jgi:hypothetical protein
VHQILRSIILKIQGTAIKLKDVYEWAAMLIVTDGTDL